MDTARIITITALFLLLDGAWTFSNVFENAPCPNRCSYKPREAMTIKCRGQTRSVKVPKEIKHLILDNCDDSNILPLSNPHSVRSVTLIDERGKYVHLEKLFRLITNVVCLKLSGSRIMIKHHNVSAFQPLKCLEYLEFDGIVFRTRSDYIFHLSVFREDYKLRSIVLSYRIQNIKSNIENVRDVLWPFRKSDLSCITYHNRYSVIFDVTDFLNCSLVDMLRYVEIFRVRNIFDITTINTASDRVIIDLEKLFHLQSRLKTLEISNGLQLRVPCKATTSKLTMKYLNENNFTFIDQCLGRKKLFDFSSFNFIENIILSHFTIHFSCRKDYETKCNFITENKIKRIDISYLAQTNINVFNVIMYGLDNLLYLNMEGNLISKLPNWFFHFLPKLETLLLGQNKLGNKLEKDDDGFFFLKLNKLKYLDLSSNDIKGLPFKVFKGLTQLEILNLTDNSLLQFEVDLVVMGRLELLVLQENTLTTISSITTYQIDKLIQRKNNQRIKVDLSNNRFTCNCGDMKFIKWLQTTKVTLIRMDNYSCTNIQGHKGTLKNIDLDALHNFCNPLTKGEISAIVLTVTLVNMTIIFVIVVYKKRHWLRYKFFRIYYYRNKANQKLLFKYDGYVCYSSEDYEWVNNQLLPKLEIEHGLNLCLDKRDFLGGNFITNNILESIEESRKTILIISPNFVLSNWCEYEMYMAHQKFLDQGYDVIVPVLYQPFEDNMGNRLLKTIIRMKTYITWDVNNSETFWKQLKEAILQE